MGRPLHAPKPVVCPVAVISPSSIRSSITPFYTSEPFQLRPISQSIHS
ncbi:hypothetical protein CEXT_471871, partial [Caerostris extrusa]